jgi:hypothetical protein
MLTGFKIDIVMIRSPKNMKKSFLFLMKANFDKLKNKILVLLQLMVSANKIDAQQDGLDIFFAIVREYI